MTLAGKVALIAGCSPNINAGIALELAAAGAKLVCVDVQPAYAQACAKAIESAGGGAIALVGDVTQEDQVLAALARAEETFGGVDVLVNGAVVQYRFGLRDMPLERFRRQIDVILTGTFLFTKHAAEQMIRLERRGSIVNIISTEAHQGNLGNIAYGTAKSGLLNFTRAAAMELAQYGIRVNSLTPTATDATEGKRRTAEWGLTWEEPSLARRTDVTAGDQGVPLGHRPRPSDYGKAAVFLASDDAAMITGIDLRVDGGTIAKYWRWNPGATVQA